MITIRQWAEKNHFDQQAIAHAMEISPASVSKWFKGNRNPGPIPRRKFLEAFGAAEYLQVFGPPFLSNSAMAEIEIRNIVLEYTGESK